MDDILSEIMEDFMEILQDSVQIKSRQAEEQIAKKEKEITIDEYLEQCMQAALIDLRLSMSDFLELLTLGSPSFTRQTFPKR
ncbi:hypothetical protein P7H21_14910 [Paenibacillus larvae]|nr:hypothetical protein [Paenibacillus larvae]MDT2304976.1 hypothetical protein [Paenibacillus larvae]